jgi:hypothetical protein
MGGNEVWNGHKGTLNKIQEQIFVITQTDIAL